MRHDLRSARTDAPPRPRTLARAAAGAAGLCAATLVGVAPASAVERVGVDADNNVVTEFGTPIRGVPFFLDAFAVADFLDGMSVNLPTYEDYYRRGLQESQMNAVRCSPWMGMHEYFAFDGDQAFDQAQYDILLDNCVQWAEDNDVYAIVNYHTQFGTVLQPDLVKGFWDVYAPRYEGKTHVVFELVNEPEIESAKREMQGIYDHVRALAPDTHMILWSVFDPTVITAQEIKASTPGIDYQADNVSVGWHNYRDVGDTGGYDRVDEFAAAGLPVINTEFWSLTDRNNYPISYGSIADNVRVSEARGRSWMLWGPFLNYEVVSTGVTHDQLKFSSTFIDAVRNGARTNATDPSLQNDVFRAGLDGQYWTKWGPSVDVEETPGPDSPVFVDTIGFGAFPERVDLSGNFTVTADYEAVTARDLVLEIFDQPTNTYLGQETVTVQPGRGSQAITASIGPIPAGTYQLKLGIRPVGADFRASLQDIFQPGVVAADPNAPDLKPTITLRPDEAEKVARGVIQYPGAGVGNYGPGSWVLFPRVELGLGGYDRIRARIASTLTGQIEVRAQRLNGPVLATIDYSGDSFDFQDTVWQEADFAPWEHTQRLYFVVTSGFANLAEIEIIDE